MSDEGGETAVLKEEENNDMDKRVCPVVRAWNLPSTNARSTMLSNLELSASRSGCFAGPDTLHLCRGGGREFTSSVQHDEVRWRASATAVRECKWIVWDGVFGVQLIWLVRCTFTT
jgi:hypothetical protein